MDRKRGTLNAVLLVAHGSRVLKARRQLAWYVGRLRRRLPGIRVEGAFLSVGAPRVAGSLDTLARMGASKIRVLPLFLLAGRHTEKDLPALVREARRRHPRVEIRLLAPLETDEGMVDVLARRVRSGR